MTTATTPLPDWFLQKVRNQRLVVLAGAGLSASPPSRLPDWNELNRMIVAALSERIDTYLGRPGYSSEIRANVDERRGADKFPPDYQAQILEENSGEDYFRALQALDVECYNPAHEALAWLAKHGVLAAIVTTNFDRLIEFALDAQSVSFDPSYEQDGYERCRKGLESGCPAPISVVKIHGTTTCPSSLVDTLKQRLLGRNKGLDRALEQLLGKHPWAFVGFSAADLETDDDYLRIIPSASASPGIAYVQWPGRPQLSAGASRLLTAYHGKAAQQTMESADFLWSLGRSLGLPEPAAPRTFDSVDTQAQVQASLKRWADSLHPAAAVNCLATLAEAAGLAAPAFNLLHRFWKDVESSDREGPAFARYRYHHGRLGVGVGILSAVDDLNSDRGMESLQNLLRVHEENPTAAAWAALALIWTGKRQELAFGLLKSAERAFTENGPAEVRADTWLAAVEVMFALTKPEGAYTTWAAAAERAKAAGDLPRQARILALISLCLAEFSPDDYPAFCQAQLTPVLNRAARLNDPGITAFAELARGRYLTKQRAGTEALEALKKAVEQFGEAGRPPWQIFAFIETAKALLDHHTPEKFQEAADLLKRLNPMVDPFQFWLPWFEEACGQAHLCFGDPEQATAAFTRAVEYAEKFQLEGKAESLRQYFEMEPLRSLAKKSS